MSLSAAVRPTAFTPYQGAKKLVVKNLRTTPRADPEQYYQRVLAQLNAALTTIFGEEESKHSLEELYKGAENVCRQGRSADLYLRLRERCESHLAGHVRECLAEKTTRLTDVDLLASYLDAWKSWSGKLVTTRSIFYYMDQTYLLRNPENPSIIQMGHTLFRSHVFQNSDLRPKIMQGVLELIESDRKSIEDERASSLLKKSIAMFHDLGTYTSDFEPNFSRSSENFFSRWALEETTKGNLAQYVNDSHALIAREIARSDLYRFDRSTRSELEHQLDQFLVTRHQSFLTSEDLVLQLLEDGDAISLEHVYSLLQRIRKGTDLGPIFDQYIREDEKANQVCSHNLGRYGKGICHVHELGPDQSTEYDSDRLSAPEHLNA